MPARYAPRLFGSMLVAVSLSYSLLHGTAQASKSPKYGVNYMIDDKRVEELFYSLVEMFGYLHEYEIVYDGRANFGILALIGDELIVDGRFDPAKIEHIREDLREYLSNLEFDGADCSIKTLSSTWNTIGDGTLNDTGERNTMTIVAANSQNHDVDQQMACLSAGVVASFAYPKEKLSEAIELPVRERIRSIMIGNLAPQDIESASERRRTSEEPGAVDEID